MEKKDDLIGKTVHDSYVIVSKLGEGAMGRVYLAENPRVSHKKYALKVLKRELTANSNFMKQFYDEAANQAQLSHPNIVQMSDYFKEGEDYYLVLEYVEGRSLADVIDERHGQPMPEKQALQIFKGVLAALNCAHQKVILHRDIKASNVMVDSSNRALLTDFGIARQVGGEQAITLGRTIGTPQYMSPEQFINSDKIDHRSDLYSAGVLLFEMLTGQLPFKSNSMEELKEFHLAVHVPNPRSVNPKIRKCLAEIVVRATQKEPDARFQGALAFLKAIERCERGQNWQILLLSLSLLLAAGIWYFVQNEKALQSLAGLSVEKYAMFCQQAERLRAKENSLRLAKEQLATEAIESRESQFGERSLDRVRELTDIVHGFAKQIQELNANVQKYSDEYRNAIHDLAEFRNSRVSKVFSEPEQGRGSGQVKQDAAAEMERARFWKLTGEDYDNYRKGDSPTRETMLKKCPR